MNFGRRHRANETYVHGDVERLMAWHHAHRADLEARGCKTLLTEASRDAHEGMAILFEAPLRVGHLIVWNSGWIETFVVRTADKETLLSGSATPDDDEPVGALLDSLAELLLA